jgi:hypothetical protein
MALASGRGKGFEIWSLRCGESSIFDRIFKMGVLTIGVSQLQERSARKMAVQSPIRVVC